MNIGRTNWDFGNSSTMTLIDGYYLEMPTNVVELTESEAAGHFVGEVEKAKDLDQNLLIAVEQGEEKKYYLVGKAAEKHVLGNRHINKLHNKTESHIPYVTFLSTLVYFYETKKDEYDIKEERNITIDYFSTMLPIWLLVKMNKFSEMQEKMAKRFLGEHKVEVLTPGFTNEYTITVNQSKCRIEGEVARWAIKKEFNLEDKTEADLFKNQDTIIVDIGGGTVDCALLPAGLKAPKSREALKFTTDIPYLGHLDELRGKLVEHFADVRELETFIVDNIAKSKMLRVDGNSQKPVDLKAPIMESLDKYASLVFTKVLDMYPSPKDKSYKYVYIGGVAEILKESIEKVVEKEYNQEIFEQNHVFLPHSRLLNLYGLEVLSINDTLTEQKAAKKDKVTSK